MDEQMLQEMYRLTKENNRMLHKMRRNAFLGGVLKIVFWAVMLLVPIWLYMVYLAPIVDDMMQTVQQIQGTSAQAQAQIGGFQDMLKQLQGKIPSL